MYAVIVCTRIRKLLSAHIYLSYSRFFEVLLHKAVWRKKIPKNTNNLLCGYISLSYFNQQIQGETYQGQGQRISIHITLFQQHVLGIS